MGVPSADEEGDRVAERRHAGQERSDGTPFVLYPLEVGSLLYHTGAPDYVIAAGVMHDLIEKAGASAADSRRQFGARIARTVLAVSDDGIEGYTQRKAALRRQPAQALPALAGDARGNVFRSRCSSRSYVTSSAR